MAMSLSMHEIALSRNCGACRFADRQALMKNKHAHEREDWEACSSPFCTYPSKLEIAYDGTCGQFKEA